MIAGLEEITDGELYIGDRLVNDVAPKDRDIAMVFQNYALYPHMTVYENMAFSLKLKKVPKQEIDKKVREAAEILGITEYLDRKPKALSGGQRQRIAIGRAIVRNPQVLLMDEPLSNLDAKLRNQMRAEIIKLRSRINTTFVYVTHDQTEAMTLGDRIVIMRDGFIQQIGTPQEVFNHPKNLFVAGFIGYAADELLPGRQADCEGRQVRRRAARQVHRPAGRQAGRPARLQAAGKAPSPSVSVPCISPASGGLPATIDVSEMMGSEMHLHMTVSGHDVIAVIPTAGLSLDDVRAGGGALHVRSGAYAPVRSEDGREPLPRGKQQGEGLIQIASSGRLMPPAFAVHKRGIDGAWQGMREMESENDMRPPVMRCRGSGMPLPATHLQSVQATVKMVNASELSLRGPGGAVAISGRQSRFRRWLSCYPIRYCEIPVASLLGMTNLFTLRH